MKGRFALLLCDAFSGHHAFRQGEDLVRSQWAEEARCILPARQQGGWSAKGQPCDAWHFQLRRHQAAYMDAVMGFSKLLLNRDLDTPLLTASGTRSRSVTHMQSIQCAMWSWQRLAAEKALLCWGWTSRGMISKEEMASIHGKSTDEFDQFLQAGKDKEAQWNLFEVPDLNPPSIQEHLHTPLPGSVKYLWQIKMLGLHDPDEGWLLLPSTLSHQWIMRYAKYQKTVHYLNLQIRELELQKEKDANDDSAVQQCQAKIISTQDQINTIRDKDERILVNKVTGKATTLSKKQLKDLQTTGTLAVTALGSVQGALWARVVSQSKLRCGVSLDIGCDSQH